MLFFLAHNVCLQIKINLCETFGLMFCNQKPQKLAKKIHLLTCCNFSVASDYYFVGGVVTVAVDDVSLGEAAELDDTLQTLDDLGAYVASDVELDEVAERYV